MTETQLKDIRRAAEMIRGSRHCVAFTGAGISLESGVPTFRGGPDSIWAKYDLMDIEISRFVSNTRKSWRTIKACFYDFMKDRDIRPNDAHRVLARMKKEGILKGIITQNIDALHQAAGSREVVEFHGTIASCTCTKCRKVYDAREVDLAPEIPTCVTCGGVLKPDFVFFGEGIPAKAMDETERHTQKADVCIVVGTTAEVMPAGMVPIWIRRNGGKVIEINPQRSAITGQYTDVYIDLGAVEAFTALEKEIFG